LWDESEGVIVRISGGSLESRDKLDVLNGANVALIGDGSSNGWEIFQYRNAELLGTGEYRLSELLRGQLGTDVEMADICAIGSEVVFLKSAPTQLEFEESDRGLARNYRVGPVDKPVADVSYESTVETFNLVALRPLSPVHLRESRESDGSINFQWVRRTRIDGDTWQGTDVPLGETLEQYHVRVLVGSTLARSELVSTTNWMYASANQISDGTTGDFTIEVAQVSERFGAGPSAVMQVNR
jgi:hypothetical protein